VEWAVTEVILQELGTIGLKPDSSPVVFSTTLAHANPTVLLPAIITLTELIQTAQEIPKPPNVEVLVIPASTFLISKIYISELQLILSSLILHQSKLKSIKMVL
jgi:hypothetical protein